MSFSSVRAGLYTTITNASTFSTTQVSSCDFGIMNFNACAVVFEPGPGTIVEAITYGDGTSRDKLIRHNFYGRVFIKDPGDATSMLNKLWTAQTDIYEAINADDSLNNTSDAAMITSIGIPTDQFVTDGGTDWRYVEFTVIADEIEGS